MNAIFDTILWFLVATQAPTVVTSQPPPDLEVVGRLKNLGYEAVEDPEDLLGHGWITARLRISRVIQGRSPSRLIIVRYLAHTYRSESSSVRLRLRRSANGAYSVCAAPGSYGVVCG